MKNKIYHSLLLIVCIVIALASTYPSEAAKPTSTPVPTETEVPAMESSEWIISPIKLEIAAMIPLVNQSVMTVIWDEYTTTIKLMITDQEGTYYIDQYWTTGDTSVLTITACNSDLWIGVNGVNVSVYHYELNANVCDCLQSSITYTPLVVR